MMNPALAALLQTAQMATPQGTPTVAQGIAKLALAKEMPQAAPPAVPEVAQDLRRALPTIQQNAQNAKLDQIADRVAQRMVPENSGIAQLPVGGDGYAEGGVIGFSGIGDEQYVRSPEEVEEPSVTRLTLKKITDYLRGKGTAYDPAAPAKTPEVKVPDYTQDLGTPILKRPDLPTTPDPQQQQVAALQKLLLSLSGAGSGRAAAPAAAAGAPATGENPLAEVQKLATRGAYAQPAPTLQQQIELSNQARAARGLTGQVGEGLEKLVQDLRAQHARLDTEREKSLKGRPLENLIQSFAAARTGGLSGLGRTYANLQSRQRAEQERFNALQYERSISLAKMDAAKEEMRESAAQNDMKGFTQALSDHRAAERDYNKLTTEATIALGRGKVDLAQVASHEREGAANRAAADRRAAAAANSRMALGIMRLMQPGKAAPGMSVPDQLKLKEHVNAVFPSKGMPTPEALTYLAKVDNGAQLIRDIANGNIKPDSTQWNASVVPALIKARELYTREFLAQTKHGAPAAVPYSQALADAED